jgi:hypothetical protein
MNDLKNFWNSRKRVDKIALVTTSVIALVVIVALASSPKGSKDTKTTAKPTTTASTSESQTTATKTVTASAKATTATKSVTTPEKATVPKAVSEAQQKALDYIDKHGADANRVQANVLIVQIALLDLQKNPTQEKLNTLAITAQDAHDRLDAIRSNFAAGGSDAELLVFSGANDLKNAMGAIVTYTGDPNPATLASLTSQYKQAVNEWNTGVRSIWKGAKKSPPTV